MSQHLHHATFSITLREDDTYECLGHITFCHDGQSFSMTEEFIVEGVKQEGRLGGPLDLLSNLLVEKLKETEIEGLILRTMGTIIV